MLPRQNKITFSLTPLNRIVERFGIRRHTRRLFLYVCLLLPTASPANVKVAGTSLPATLETGGQALQQQALLGR